MYARMMGLVTIAYIYLRSEKYLNERRESMQRNREEKYNRNRIVFRKMI